jgi:hypothetical protein
MWIFFFSFVRVIALDLQKYKFEIFNLFMHISKNISLVGLKVYKNVGQHVYLCTLGFVCGFIQYFKVLGLYLVKKNFSFQKRLTKQWRGGGTRVLWTHF